MLMLLFCTVIFSQFSFNKTLISNVQHKPVVGYASPISLIK